MTLLDDWFSRTGLAEEMKPVFRLGWLAGIEESAMLVELKYDELEPWITAEDIRAINER